MPTKTIAEPEVLLRPSDDGRRTTIRKRIAVAVLGLALVGGLALAAGANSTSTSPAPAPAPVRAEPAASPGPTQTPLGGCLADSECYGESQLIPNNPAPPVAVPEVPGPDHNEPRYSPAD